MGKVIGVAAGLYLVGLRDREPGLTRAKLAREMKLDVKRLERWENGENRPNIDAIRPVIDRLSGSIDEFMALWENAPGTIEDAQNAIARTLGQVESINKAADTFAADMTDEELAEIISLGRRLQKEDRSQWVEMARHFLKRAGGRSGAS